MENFITRLEHEEFAKRMEEEHNRQNHRIGNLEKNYEQLTELTICVKEQTMTLDNMAREVKSQGEKLEKITGEPARVAQRIRDKAIDTVVGVIVGAAIVALFFIISPYIK